jgi:hypothetical protein
MALQLPTSQQPVENPQAVGQSIKINPYLCQPQTLLEFNSPDSGGFLM